MGQSGIDCGADRDRLWGRQGWIVGQTGWIVGQIVIDCDADRDRLWSRQG